MATALTLSKELNRQFSMVFRAGAQGGEQVGRLPRSKKRGVSRKAGTPLKQFLGMCKAGLRGDNYPEDL